MYYRLFVWLYKFVLVYGFHSLTVRGRFICRQPWADGRLDSDGLCTRQGRAKEKDFHVSTQTAKVPYRSTSSAGHDPAERVQYAIEERCRNRKAWSSFCIDYAHKKKKTRKFIYFIFSYDNVPDAFRKAFRDFHHASCWSLLIKRLQRNIDLKNISSG